MPCVHTPCSNKKFRLFDPSLASSKLLNMDIEKACKEYRHDQCIELYDRPDRLNTATWNYVYTGHPSFKSKLSKIKRQQDANKFSDGGIGLFDIWEFANHQNAKQYNTALSKQNDQVWAHKWINKPNKKARNFKKKWKKATYEQNMKDLNEWKKYQPKPPEIKLECQTSKPKIWNKIISLPVHPTVKNFIFKRCRRMVRTVKECIYCQESGYTHIIHGECQMNQGNKYSMEDFLNSFNNRKHNQGLDWSGVTPHVTPAEVANTWYANWFTYQAENNWLDGEHTNTPPSTTESSNAIRAKVLETLSQITGQLTPNPLGST